MAIKSLGQHWLNDQTSLDIIIDFAGVTSEDTVLEIGPGQGSLTRRLIKRAKRIISVEIDHNLVKKLERELPASNFEIVESNILEFDLTQLPPGYKIVANIPYYLTSKLIRIISETKKPPKVAVLLVQKEVAQRVCAAPGEMSLLSLTAQFYFDCQLGPIITAEKFSPPPKVDSQLVKLTKKTNSPYNVAERQFFQLVKSGFASRRKTLSNSLSAGLRMDKSKVEQIIAEAKLNKNIRPQNLSIEDWYKLYVKFSARLPV